MEKIVLVKGYFIAIGEEFQVKVPTGEKKKGFFGAEKEVTRLEKQWKQTGYSDSIVDAERLANDLQEAVDILNSDGYVVKTITPITSGNYNYRYKEEGVSSTRRFFGEGAELGEERDPEGPSYGYGYGFSYTDSLIVVAEKR